MTGAYRRHDGSPWRTIASLAIAWAVVATIAAAWLWFRGAAPSTEEGPEIEGEADVVEAAPRPDRRVLRPVGFEELEGWLEDDVTARTSRDCGNAKDGKGHTRAAGTGPRT